MDRIAHATIRMQLSELLYYTVQSCVMAHALWSAVLSMYEKKATATKLYLIWRLYNLRMKESDSPRLTSMPMRPS